MEIVTDIYEDFDRYEWFSLRNEKTQQSTTKGELSQVILSTFSSQTNRQLHNVKVNPMKGSATVSVEKDDDGNTTATAEISVSSDDGTVEISGSGSVDQDGNASGKLEATVNWQNDD